MIVLVGKTCSGKDTISNILIEKYGYKKLITYTTRPMRVGEVNGQTYHFITESDFKKKVEEGFFFEYKEYNTVNGVWYYGSAKEDYLNASEDTIVILSPSGLKALKDWNEELLVKIIMLDVDEPTMRLRLLQRGDDIKEAERRIQADNLDFKGAEDLVDKVFVNDFIMDADCLADAIHEYVFGYNFFPKKQSVDELILLHDPESGSEPWYCYCEVCIDESGNIYECIPSHQEFAIAYAQRKEYKTRDEVINDIPTYASPLHYIAEKYHLVFLWYNHRIAYKDYNNPAVSQVIKKLEDAKLIRKSKADISCEFSLVNEREDVAK